MRQLSQRIPLAWWKWVRAWREQRFRYGMHRMIATYEADYERAVQAYERTSQADRDAQIAHVTRVLCGVPK